MGLCQLAGAVMPALSAETGKGMATRLVHHRSAVMEAGIPANASFYQGARAYCPSLIGHSSSVRLSSATYGLQVRLRLSPDNRRTRYVMAYRSLYLHWRSAFTYFCCLRAPACACVRLQAYGLRCVHVPAALRASCVHESRCSLFHMLMRLSIRNRHRYLAYLSLFGCVGFSALPRSPA